MHVCMYVCTCLCVVYFSGEISSLFWFVKFSNTSTTFLFVGQSMSNPFAKCYNNSSFNAFTCPPSQTTTSSFVKTFCNTDTKRFRLVFFLSF
uniref:Uncharacterized protein n=1 Tax=Octopus bimaculoides TaxID=37653 RepID=A0A0L8HPD0_OCTBM